MNPDHPLMLTRRAACRTWLGGLLAGSVLGSGPTRAADGADGAAPDCSAAYTAFFPLYEMARLRYVATEQAGNPRRHDLHSFNHSRQLLDHTARTVTAPNNDTLYSSARLDLRHGPVVVETPAMAGRYYSLHFMNFHTDNLAILGRRAQGDGPLRVALVGPGWSGPVPAHSQRVDADTHDLWLLVRTLVDGPDDLPAVAALQDAMRITAPRPASDYPRQRSVPPKDPQPEQFLRVVNEFLQRNPPQGRMARLAAAARPLGLGADAPDWSALDEAVRARWTAAWPAATAAVADARHLVARRVQGWEYPPAEVGQWGDRLALRATVALRGIAALDTSEALYLSSFVDSEGRALDGTQRYRVQLPPGGLPARAFWSLSMYEVLPDGRFFFAPNPLHRYSVGNRTRGLRANADGSLDLLLQQARPTNDANWLPTPGGPFRLTLRAYLPAPELVRGEAPLPRIERRSS